MKRRIITGIVVLAVVAALVGGWLLSQRAGATSVTVAKATTQTLAVSATASGRLEAPKATTVSAPAAGTLASIPVADCAQVSAGQLLARLDPGPLDLAVKQAQAQAAAARAMPTGSTRVNAARNAAIASADAAVTDARANRARADISAPASGTLRYTSLSLVAGQAPLFETHVGASVTAGQQLFTIVDASQLQFDAQVDEADIAGVRTGQAAHVALDAYPGRTFMGKVDSIKTAAITTSTGGVAFDVLIAVDAGDARLFLGMSGDGVVDVSSVADAVVVPVQAVVAESGKQVVWKVSGSTVTHTEVTLGATTDTLAQITGGLASGDVVASSNLSALKDGASVNVQS